MPSPKNWCNLLLKSRKRRSEPSEPATSPTRSPISSTSAFNTPSRWSPRPRAAISGNSSPPLPSSRRGTQRPTRKASGADLPTAAKLTPRADTSPAPDASGRIQSHWVSRLPICAACSQIPQNLSGFSSDSVLTCEPRECPQTSQLSGGGSAGPSPSAMAHWPSFCSIERAGCRFLCSRLARAASVVP